MNIGGNTGKEVFGEFVADLVVRHGLDEDDQFKMFLGQKSVENNWCLYIRLWAEARQRLYPSPTMSLLNRDWVLAATYDGVSVALLTWAGFIVLWMLRIGFDQPLSFVVGIPILMILLLLSLACSREAGRYAKKSGSGIDCKYCCSVPPFATPGSG